MELKRIRGEPVAPAKVHKIQGYATLTGSNIRNLEKYAFSESFRINLAA